MSDTTKPCGCTDDVPCLKHASVWADKIMNSPEFLAWDLAQIKSDIDMAGPPSCSSCGRRGHDSRDHDAVDVYDHRMTDEERAWGCEHLTGNKCNHWGCR